MRTYFCYIHTLESRTPHMRAVFGGNNGLSRALAAAAIEWPARRMIEVFDEGDQFLFRLMGVAPAGAAIVSHPFKSDLPLAASAPPVLEYS